MYDDYCFRCGCYTAIDRLTKMCKRCYDRCATDTASKSRTPSRDASGQDRAR
jgi:hypothetical protein